MATPPTDSPKFDLTVRVGCSLAYEATGPAMLLLNLRPTPDRNHAIVFEAFTAGDNLPAEEFTDSHGNKVTRVKLAPGRNLFRHDAIVRASSRPDNHDLTDRTPHLPADLPPRRVALHAAQPVCGLGQAGQFRVGKIRHRRARLAARAGHQPVAARQHRVSLYVRPARPVGVGTSCSGATVVCRDFAHLAIALNRSFNLPTRYVTGHLPDIGFPDPENHMDFHAYAEVYLGGEWHTTDARFHVPRIGRIKVSCGQDAVDGAFSTIYGGATLSYFEVWAYQVARGTVGVGDPVDFTKRLDNSWTVRTDPAEA